MILEFAAILAGFALLVWSADRFVLGASAVASIMGVSTLVVGILVVGIGTSAPEMLVSGIAAYEGKTGLSVGNALGSNITNIALVLGFSCLLIPLQVQSKIIKREIPLLLVIMIFGWFLLMDGELGFLDGALLFVAFGLVIVRQLLEAKNSRADILEASFEDEIPKDMPLPTALFWLLLGFLVLVGSARLLVWGAVEVALAFGVSELIVGLTVVAIGTSLPELAATIAAARKGEHDIAIGNVIGSNIFNLVGVMALPGIIAPGIVDPDVMARDYPLMLGLTVLLFLFASEPVGKRVIGRWKGAVFLSIYIGYLIYLVQASMAA